MNHNNSRTRTGFTLIEAMIAAVIVGLGLVAVVSAVGSDTRAHGFGKELNEGVFLAEGIREWILKLPFSDPDEADVGNPPGPDGNDPLVFVDDLDDMLNVTFSPPRDGQGSPIENMQEWSQTVTMTWRDPDNLGVIVADGDSDVVHIQVEVKRRGRSILRTGWMAARIN